MKHLSNVEDDAAVEKNVQASEESNLLMGCTNMDGLEEPARWVQGGKVRQLSNLLIASELGNLTWLAIPTPL